MTWASKQAHPCQPASHHSGRMSHKSIRGRWTDIGGRKWNSKSCSGGKELEKSLYFKIKWTVLTMGRQRGIRHFLCLNGMTLCGFLFLCLCESRWQRGRDTVRGNHIFCGGVTFNSIDIPNFPARAIRIPYFTRISSSNLEVYVVRGSLWIIATYIYNPLFG